MTHVDLFWINITISDMHQLIAMIFYVSNNLQNTNVTIHERVWVSPSPYYMDCFEKYHPNIPINQDDIPFVFYI